MAFSICYFISPIIYPLSDRIGYRTSMFIAAALFGFGILASSFARTIHTLFFTIGVMVAVGYSMCQASSMFILPHYFGYNWSLALGISLSGSSFGAVAFSSLKAYLFSTFGYRVGMQVLAVTAIPLAFGGLLFKKREKMPHVSADDDSPEIEDRYPPLSRNRAFHVLLIASFIYHSVYLITYVHLVSKNLYITSRGTQRCLGVKWFVSRRCLSNFASLSP